MYGWEDLGKIVYKVYESLPEEEKSTRLSTAIIIPLS
jgi:hypothetical protein